MMAIGTVSGRAARRAAASGRASRLLLAGAAVFGVGCTLAALMPSYWLFGVVLVVDRRVGADLHQHREQPGAALDRAVMRGRVMAIRSPIALGGTPIGAPIVGWVADRFGPRWALGVGAASGFAAAIVAVRYLAKYRHLRAHIDAGRVRFEIDAETVPGSPRRHAGEQQA